MKLPNFARAIQVNDKYYLCGSTLSGIEAISNMLKEQNFPEARLTKVALRELNDWLVQKNSKLVQSAVQVDRSSFKELEFETL